MRNRSLVAVLAAALAAPAQAGVVITVEQSNGQSVMTLDGERMRIDDVGGDAGGRTSSMIFDGKTHVLYHLDADKKTVTRVDQAATNELTTRYRAAMEQAKAKMTPEQRARIEAMMAKRGMPATAEEKKEPVYTFERTSGGESVAGYSCQHYRMLEDGKAKQEGCFIPWSAGAVSKDDLVALREMAKWGAEMATSFRSGMGTGTGSARRHGGSDLNHRFSAWLDHGPGFPAVLDHLDDQGKRTRESRVVKIEHRSIPASAFVVPAEYTEQRLGGERGGFGK